MIKKFKTAEEKTSQCDFFNNSPWCKINLIFGIGNPEKKYQNTYHNIGLSFIDFLIKKFAKKAKTEEQKNFFYAKIKSLPEYYHNLIFAKTYCFMNESGFAIKQALVYFGIKSENLLIVHDDADIALGDFKFSFNKDSAGHKGITSIINALSTKNFWRLRIGIRDNNIPINKEKAGSFVLKKISKSHKKIFTDVFSSITNSSYF